MKINGTKDNFTRRCTQVVITAEDPLEAAVLYQRLEKWRMEPPGVSFEHRQTYDYIKAQGGANTHQVAAYFDIAMTAASNRLHVLFNLGVLQRVRSKQRENRYANRLQHYSVVEEEVPEPDA